MATNTAPIFSLEADFQSAGTLTTAAADYAGTNVNNSVGFTAGPDGGYLDRIMCKPLGTNVASVLRVYINNGSGRLVSQVAAPAGTPTGTPSTTGGSLIHGTGINYFARIVAVDQYGANSAASTETAVVATTTSVAGSITWNWTASVGAASYRIYVGNVTNGQVSYFTSTTNSFVQTAAVGLRDSLLASLPNNYFIGEVSLPATTISANAALPDIAYPLNFPIPANHRVLVGLGTTVAAGWHVTVAGGKY